jgi:subtilisin family serine protease
MYRRLVRSLAGLAIALTLLTGATLRNRAAERSSALEAQAADRRYDLSPVERAFIALQLARGEGRVVILIAAKEGQTEKVCQKLRAIFGEVLMQDAEIGFIRARISIARGIDVMAWPEITVAQIDTGDEAALFAVDGRSETDGMDSIAKRPGIPPSAYTARDNPYTAESTTQSLQFKTDHPTYDGRGAVIGGIEPVDIRTPSLRRALSLQGASIAKFADYVLPIPPSISVGAVPEKGKTDYGWQQTKAVHPDKDHAVNFNGKAYVIPESVGSDELRMALVRARPVRAALPYSPGISSEMTVLWAVKAGRVWLCEGEQTDFNRGLSFTSLPAMPHRPALAQLRNGDNRTFMVAVDLPTKALRLRYGTLYHGTMGASTAAGHTFLNSEAEGVAPGAQFLPVDFGSAIDQTTMQLPALIDLFRDPRVDVITNSSGMGDARRLLGSRNVYREWMDRLDARYSKIMFKSAGNLGPYGIKELGFSHSDSVITVGAYTPLEAWETNFGLTPTEPNTPPSYSSYGPSSDGGFGADLLSLTGTLCAGKAASSLSVFGASPYYEMPVGYGLSGGTSAATPNAAGHAALLISAAKQSSISYDLTRLKIALFSSCLFLDGVEAQVQGHGLIQIARAWDVLRRIKNYTVPTFSTEAPVRTYYSSQLSTPNVGRGIYERIGWSPGQSGDREVTITRTSGPTQPIVYHLRWQEAPRRAAGALRSPAFSSRISQVSLPLNQPVKISVHIQVGESGSYSAVLDLIDPNMDVVVHSVMCTIITAEQLTSDNGYSVSVTRAAPHPGNGLVFVNVPSGTAALHIQVRQKSGKLVTMNAQTPDGGRPRVSTEPDSVPSPWQLEPSAREVYDQTFANPQPGVWQFWVDHENGFIDTYDPSLPRPAPACEFIMRVSAIGGQLKTVLGKSGSEMKVSFTGQLAKITNAHVIPLALGRMREEETVLPMGLSPVFYEVDVAQGTTKLKATVTAGTETATSVSVIIFRLNDDKPNLATNVAFDIGSGSQKQVEVVNPKPGKYKICLDAWGAVPAKGLRVRYREELYGPQYGRLVVTGEPTTKDDRIQASISWQARWQAITKWRLVSEVALLSDDYVNMSNAQAKGKAAQSSLEIATQPVPIAVTTIILPQE